MKTNRAISSLLAFCMLIGMVTLLPLTAQAADPPTVQVGDKPGLDNDKYYTVSGNNLEVVTDPSDNYIRLSGNTLTLKNFNYTAPEGNNAIYITGDCNIVKEGSSEIHGGNGRTSCGIRCIGSLTFTGSGTLTAAGGEVTGGSGRSYGVYAGGNITVSDGTLTAAGGEATGEYGVSYGVSAGGDITVSDGSLTGTGGEAAGKNSGSQGVSAGGNIKVLENGTLTGTGGAAAKSSLGVSAREITVSEGTLTGTGGEATGESGRSYGVSAEGNITVSEGTLTGTGGEATGEYGRSDGVSAREITVSEGTLTGTGDRAANSFGVFAEKITVSENGTLTGTGGEAVVSQGVSAGEITVSEGTLTGTGGEATGEYSSSRGVFVRGNITVSENGTLTGTGDRAAGENSGSTGVSAGGNIKVSENGTLTGTGGEAADENSVSWGVYAGGDITVSENGTLTAAGENFALYVYGSVTISGGTLIINRGALLSGGTLTNNGTIIDNTIVPYTPTDVTVPYTPTDVTDVNAGQDPFVIFLQKTIQQIASAKEGATITIDFDDFNVLTLPVMKQMAMRRDLTIQMKYCYKGQKFEVTFPAGMPINYSEDIPYYGPLKLADMANRDGGKCSIIQ